MIKILVGLIVGFILGALVRGKQSLRIRGVEFMYIVKADNPDVGYGITIGEVKDSEGNPIPDTQVVVKVGSDNNDVVAVNSRPDDPKTGTIHFGSPGRANVQVKVEDAGGRLLGIGAAAFLVTTGDPASVSGVSLAFDGLTEAPEEPAPAG